MPAGLDGGGRAVTELASVTQALSLGSAQAPLYGLFNRAAGRAIWLNLPGEAFGLVLTDALTQAMFHWDPLDNPVASGPLSSALIISLLHLGHFVDVAWDQMAREMLRRMPRDQAEAMWRGPIPAEGMLLQMWPRQVGMHSVINTALIMAELPGKALLRQHDWLPSPTGTVNGRYTWATPAEYWANLTYDIAVHAVLVGSITTVLGGRPPLGLMPQDLRAEYHRIAELARREGNPLPWTMRPGWHSGLASMLAAAFSKALSELITNPPPGWPGAQAGDQEHGDLPFGALAWTAVGSYLEAVLTGGLDLVRNVPLPSPWTLPWTAWLYGERGVLATRATWARWWNNNEAEAQRLERLPAMAAFSPGTQATVLAASDRASRAARKVLAKAADGPVEHAVQAAFHAAGLVGDLADTVMAKVAGPDPRLDEQGRQELAARAREQLAADWRGLTSSTRKAAEAYAEQTAYRMAGRTPPARPGHDPAQTAWAEPAAAGRGRTRGGGRSTPGRGAPTQAAAEQLARMRAGWPAVTGGSALVVESAPPARDDGDMPTPADGPSQLQSQAQVAAPVVSPGPAGVPGSSPGRGGPTTGADAGAGTPAGQDGPVAWNAKLKLSMMVTGEDGREHELMLVDEDRPVEVLPDASSVPVVQAGPATVDATAVPGQPPGEQRSGAQPAPADPRHTGAVDAAGAAGKDSVDPDQTPAASLTQVEIDGPV